MSFEVVYTSVRRGLRTGAKGFCTVAATEGIPRALHEKLESLSGYRHSEAAAGGAPPINYSHLIVRVQRKIYHVVSRIGDAGIDYSGRTNKIAHHLALTSAETEPYRHGPVSLFLDDGFWCESWDGDPEELPPRNLPDGHASTTTDFDTWESVFGDSGWAGILGEAAVNGMKPVSIIVPNADVTIDLLNEALQLVPPELRWKLCFSTYFSRLAPGTQCHWRFVLDGTGEARRLRARSLGALVDPIGSAAELSASNPFVKAARECQPELAHTATGTSVRSRSRRQTSDDGDAEIPRTSRGRRRAPAESRPRVVTAANPFDYNEEDFSDDEPEEESELQSGTRRRSRKQSRRAGLWIVLGLFGAVIAILAFFAIQQLS